jgi:WD40 repeat protein
MAKLVILTFDGGESPEGFKVNLEIGNENEQPSKISGNLPPNPTICENYQCWRAKYLDLDKRWRGRRGNTRSIDDPSKIHEQCSQSAGEFLNGFKNWLTSEDRAWQKLREEICQELGDKTEAIRVIIQTDDPQLKKFPWHEWDLFADTYTQAEVALCPPEYKKPIVIQTSDKAAVRILAILGNSEGIDVESDRQLIEKFRLKGAEPKFLVEPKRTDVSNSLWEQNWDILFFTGHSSSQDEKGQIDINPNDRLTIEELKNGLKRAMKHGLQLAIFNSCDGLKLADDLADLKIPQVIVMREPVPDKVAQAFLKLFLTAYSQGESLDLAVRHARERLHENAWDEKFPGASWLPVLYQNPTVKPPTWYQLGGSFPIKTWECKHVLWNEESVNAMVISPDSQTLVSFDRNNVKIWDLQTEKPRLESKRRDSNPANCVVISPDNQFMACSRRHIIMLRNPKTGQPLCTFGDRSSQHSDKVNCLAISSNGQLISGSKDKTIKIWALDTKRLLHTIDAHSDEVKFVAISPNGQILTSVSTEEIKIWNSSTDTHTNPNDDEIPLSVQQRSTFKFDELSLLNNSFVISNDGQIIAGVSDNKTIKVWNLHTGKLSCTLNIPSEKSDQFVVGKPIGFTLGAQILVTGSKNQGAFWDLQTGILRYVYTLEGFKPSRAGLGHSATISAVSPDGKIIAITGGSVGKIRIFREQASVGVG